MSPVVHSEIEFEFREGDEGDGEFIACGKVISALRRMLGEGRIEEAADLFAACADDVGTELIDDTLSGVASSRRMKSLAQMFHLAKDYARAAQCAEKSGDRELAAKYLAEQGELEAAAELCSRSGDLARAAALFERNLNFARAAELYLQLKDYRRAAGAFDRAGDLLQAGRLYAQVGRFDAALATLQRVPPDEPSFAGATLLVGRILEHTNNGRAALERYWSVVQLGAPTAETRPVWLHLATKLAEGGETLEARQLVQRLLESDPRDLEAVTLAQRLSGLNERRGTKKEPTFEVEVDMSETSPGHPAVPPGKGPPPPPVARAVPPPPPTAGPPPTSSRENRIVGMDHDFEFLRRVPLFARLSLDEQKYVRRLCEQARFGAGEALISEGQPGQAMFVIIRGRVDVRSSAPDGSTSLVAELGPGAHVGEMALIDDAPTSASVVARETVYSFRLARDQFEALLRSNQRIQLRIYTVLVQTLVKRLREANAKLAARHD